MIGESKRSATLDSGAKAQVKKYLDLCAMLHADDFVVVTAQEQWTSGAAAFLDGLASKLQAGTRIYRLTGNDIRLPQGFDPQSPDAALQPDSDDFSADDED